MDGPQNDSEVFADAVKEVIEYREAGRGVLIHCSAGASHSPSVAAAAIASFTDKTLNEAFNQIIEQRPETDSHDALVKQVVKFTET